MADNSPVVFKRRQNSVEKRTGGRSPPTTVNSSVRTREYLTTAEIERLMAAARKSSRYGHRDMCGWVGNGILARAPLRPNSAWKVLRHGCGYALANAGHDTRALQAWLGHKNIQHTVRYTELAPDRFRNFWR
jgi:type 1 fimbriae regulatory protein FimB/type 1 fimbriae regulatory protein FimE